MVKLHVATLAQQLMHLETLRVKLLLLYKMASKDNLRIHMEQTILVLEMKVSKKVDGAMIEI